MRPFPQAQTATRALHSASISAGPGGAVLPKVEMLGRHGAVPGSAPGSGRGWPTQPSVREQCGGDGAAWQASRVAGRAL